MAYKKYIIEKQYKSVYFFLKSNGFSENFITNLRKKEGYIKVNDNIVNIRKPLSQGDELCIEDSPNTKTSIMHCILPLNIVYEDEYYLIVNKPSGLDCMPNKSHYSSNLAGAICYYFNDKENFVLRIINRLDKDTAGLILVAKSSIAQKDVKDIKKTYYAVCKGKIDKDIVIDKKIETIVNGGINEKRRIVSEQGKEAKTFVHPIKIGENYSLLALSLIHGRTHQIRLHLSSISHPLVGDELYGEKDEEVNHTLLICKEFSFFHPYLNKTLNFEIDFPEDFKKYIEKIK